MKNNSKRIRKKKETTKRVIVNLRGNSVVKWSIFIAWLNMDLAWCQFAVVAESAREKGESERDAPNRARSMQRIYTE